MAIELYSYQIEAIDKLKSGAILCGGVGSGKSRTALTYYYTKECKGNVVINGKGEWKKASIIKHLYIITTAKKRDSLEWEQEAIPFLIGEECSGVNMTVDSWNNISKYVGVKDAFFIFDEQRVVGYGTWSKAFITIAKKNHWILLSATPGDKWIDYMPAFVANGFYKNKSDFNRKHVVYNSFAKFPQIDYYVNTKILIQHRNDILVKMDNGKRAKQVKETITVNYDPVHYKIVAKDRWDIYDNKPIKETGKLGYLMRKVVNSDDSRLDVIRELFKEHKKLIIFYNFDYELMLLRELAEELVGDAHAEWNGKKHEILPEADAWIYLVQYSAGAEGWNCIETNTIIFYSQSYSYRMTVQAAGRIDRVNTPYDVLYYYYLRSSSPIDIAIARALEEKKNFNEKAFLGL